MRKLMTLMLGAVLSVTASCAALADKRVALVVGNSAYRNVPSLDNPKNDARLISETLRDLGFTLVGGGAQIDLEKSALETLLQTFGNAIKGADVVLFYYAGHGLQVQGRNFLVPVGANPTSESDVFLQMIDTSIVMSKMSEAQTKLNIVVLDACRNNPFGNRGLRATSGGLAQMQAPQGTIVSYATQPGNVAKDGTDGNSPYTKALAKMMRQPGLDVFRVFNQVGLAVMDATNSTQEPWVSNSPIRGDFYFAAAPATAPVAAPALPPPVAAAPAPSEDEITWSFLKDSTDIASMQRFLTRFPSSRLRGEVQTRMASLERAKAPAPAAPALPPVAAVPPPPTPAPVTLPQAKAAPSTAPSSPTPPQQQASLAPAIDSSLTAPVDTRALPELRVRMTSSFAKSLEAGEDGFVKRLGDLSGGKIAVQNFAAGEIVPGLQALEAVSNNVVEMAWSLGSYYTGKDPAFQLLTNVPLGFDGMTHIAWRRQPDVANAIAALLRKTNVVSMPCGLTGMSIDVIARKLLQTPADLRGVKMRTGGISGQILAKLGVVPQQIAGGDIYPALEKGTIDATIWSDPYRTEKLGFNKIALYFYYPGVLDGGDVVDLFISQPFWDKLPPAGRQVIQRACAESITAQNAFNVRENQAAIARLAASGTKIVPLPLDIRRAMLGAWDNLAAEFAGKSPTFKTLLESANQRRSEMVAASLR